MSYFQDGGHDAISCRKVLLSGEHIVVFAQSLMHPPAAAYSAVSAGCSLTIPSTVPNQ